METWQKDNVKTNETKLTMIADVLKHKQENKLTDEVALNMIKSIMKVGQE